MWVCSAWWRPDKGKPNCYPQLSNGHLGIWKSFPEIHTKRTQSKGHRNMANFCWIEGGRGVEKKCITSLVSTGVGFPENFVNHHPWKYSALDCTRPEPWHLTSKLSLLWPRSWMRWSEVTASFNYSQIPHMKIRWHFLFFLKRLFYQYDLNAMENVTKEDRRDWKINTSQDGSNLCPSTNQILQVRHQVCKTLHMLCWRYGLNTLRLN